MKKYFILVSLLLVMSGVYSQSYTTIVNETFSSTPTGWTVIASSSATWSRDTNYYLSSPSSYKGNVPSSSSAGDSVVLISPVFDLSQYPYVFLRFSHICKVSIADKCQISIKENYTGSQWRAIPASCYLGSANNYSKERKFSDDSYNDWRSDSLWLQPTNGWWKTENFDITSEANYAPVQFKFTITKGSTVGTEFAAGWFIDNFELFASMNQIMPPVVEFIAPLIPDTVNHTGPFTINAKVATRTNLPIIQPKLEIVYTYGGNVSYDTLLMTNVTGDSLWRAEIPQTLFGTNVKYTINASDSVGNKSFATGEFYVKRIGIGDSNSVAIASIDYPNQLVVGGQPTPVVVTITNKGLKALDSCVLNWSVNGVLQTPYIWKGYLLDGYSDQDTIGYYSPRLNFNDTIIVWVGMPNGVVDAYTFDDTTSIYTYGCANIFRGEYIIGSKPGADFTNLSTAISTLFGGCGSSGNVIFKLQNDTLVENVDLKNLRNFLGSNDTLIITSVSGNANDAVIKPLDSCGFTIGKSNNIIIKNITIDVSSATSKISHGIYFVDTCTNIWIDSCVIIAKNVTDTGYDCIHQLTTKGCLTDIYIMNNTLIDGFHGVYLSGPSGRNINVNICNNNVNSFLVGISLKLTNFTNINNNYVTRNSNTARWCHGIMFLTCYGKELCNNRINISGAGGPPQASWSSAGLSFYSGNTQGASATDRLLVANNEIIITASTGTNGQAAKGIYCSSAPNHTDFLHNSVLMLGNTAGSASASPLCLDIVNGTNLANKVTIYNNNFINLSGIATATKNYAMQLPTNTVGFVRDYNNYYSVGPNCVGTRNAGYASIQAWVTAFNLDSNSVSVLPDSITAASTDLRVEGSQILCPVLPLVPNDINNNPRIGKTNMGCYSTYVPDSYDAGVVKVSSSRIFADSVYPSILVSIINLGTQTLDSVEIHWTVNSYLQNPYIWRGSLERGQTSEPINIGKCMAHKGINVISVYTSNPNGQPLDADHSNDTLYYKGFASGTYTVGGADAYFYSLPNAMYQLNEFGILGPVELQLTSGVYDTLVLNNNVPGADSINTLCITSVAGDADSVIFQTTSGVALTLDGISHLQFKKVTFNAVSGTCGVELKNFCSDILFYECNIAANPTTTASTNVAVRHSQATNSITYLSKVQFIKNNISGGYYNFHFNISAGIATNMSKSSITIDSNMLTDAYNSGIYSNSFAYYPSISYNTIKSRSNTNATYHGIYTNSNTTIDTMRSNKIYVTSISTSVVYGMRLYRNQNRDLNTYYARGPMFVANNEINVKSSGQIYGIYAYATSYYSRFDIINNSVFTSGSSNTCYGLSLYPSTTSGYKSTVFNNHFHIQTTSTAYPLFVSSITYINPTYCSLDYNNYCTSGTESTVNIGTSSYKSLSSWQSAVYDQDAHSMNIVPVYLDSLTSLKYVYNSNLLSPQIAGVERDITGRMRSLSTLIGAYESDCKDLAIDSIVYPSYGEIFCQNNDIPVTISISNKGSVDYIFAEDSINLHLRVSGAFSYSKDTTIKTGSLLANSSLNITIDNNFGLLNAGIANLSVYLSQADANIGNDSALTSIYINPTYRNYDTLRIGDNQLPALYGDSVINLAGDYTVVFSLINNCDSIIDLHVIVDSTYHIMSTVTLCDDELPFSFADSIFTSAGNYDVYINALVGSDTIVHLTLIVNPTYNHTDTVTLCDSELPLTYGDSVLASAGNFDIHFSSIHGCDSLIELTLYVNPTYNHTDTVTLCDSELPLNYGDSVLTQAGSYNIHFHTVLGCDSLVVLQLYVNPTYTKTDTVTICDSELPLTYGDSVLASAGNYDIHFSSIHGCDSLIQLTLYVNPTYIKTDTLTICVNELPYNYGDSVLTQAGDFEVHFNSIHACDSTVNLTLYVKPTSGSNDTITICDSEFPYSYGDSIFNVGGLHQVYYTAVNGCDSVVDLLLYVNPTYSKTDTVTICDTELPYTYGDSILTADGSYNIHFASLEGCDSLIVLRLYVKPSFSDEDTITICDSELPYTYGDSVLNTGGSFDIHYTAINGCDSMIILMLYVNPTFNQAETLDICDSQLPYFYGDSVFTAEGDYVIPFVSMHGCDSVINLRLNVFTVPATPLKINGDTVITQAGNYTYSVDLVQGAQSYEWSISNPNWTGTSTSETISINIPAAGSATIGVKAVNECGISDATTLNVKSSVNINEKDAVVWVLGQNIPNPATATTLIPYTIPQDGKVVFSVMSINGQVLYTKHLQATAGSHLMEIDLNTLSVGIYYYSLEYQGQRIVKKMTIQK